MFAIWALMIAQSVCARSSAWDEVWKELERRERAEKGLPPLEERFKAPRVWKDIEGREIAASYVSHDENFVSLRMGKKDYTVKLSRFSANDRAYLKYIEMPETEKRARNIVIPSMRVRNFSLRSLSDYLNQKVKDLAPHQAPLNIMISNNSFWCDRVNLAMEESSCYAILVAAAEYAGCDVIFDVPAIDSGI